MKNTKTLLLTATLISIFFMTTTIPHASESMDLSSEWTGYIRIEGKQETVYSGEITVGGMTISAKNESSGEIQEFSFEEPTALGALVEASLQAGFSYELVYYPNYDSILVTAINDDIDWWHFFVDFTLPMIGASAYILDEDDQSILFGYLENWYVHALKIESDNDSVKQNQDLTITITDESDIPVPQAAIYIDDETYFSDMNGTATVKISKPGTYQIYAEKDGYLRSEALETMVEKPKMKALDLILRFSTHSFVLNLFEMIKHLVF